VNSQTGLSKKVNCDTIYLNKSSKQVNAGGIKQGGSELGPWCMFESSLEALGRVDGGKSQPTVRRTSLVLLCFGAP
jgi:hypothetical protein